MLIHTIRSAKWGDIRFRMHELGGPIELLPSGALLRQYGRLEGFGVVRATPDTFSAACRAWYKLRNARMDS